MTKSLFGREVSALLWQQEREDAERSVEGEEGLCLFGQALH